MRNSNPLLELGRLVCNHKHLSRLCGLPRNRTEPKTLQGSFASLGTLQPMRSVGDSNSNLLPDKQVRYHYATQTIWAPERNQTFIKGLEDPCVIRYTTEALRGQMDSNHRPLVNSQAHKPPQLYPLSCETQIRTGSLRLWVSRVTITLSRSWLSWSRIRNNTVSGCRDNHFHQQPIKNPQTSLRVCLYSFLAI